MVFFSECVIVPYLFSYYRTAEKTAELIELKFIIVTTPQPFNRYS